MAPAWGLNLDQAGERLGSVVSRSALCCSEHRLCPVPLAGAAPAAVRLGGGFAGLVGKREGQLKP